MNYKIITTSNFEKELKKLTKKFPSLKVEVAELQTQLFENPFLGTPIGKNSFKIRLAVKSKGKGKSGGMRVITYIQIDVLVDDLSNIFMLSIFDKSEMQNISDEELQRLINIVKN